ncbi:MAG TPA: hypothetical protein VFX86_00495 [Candidatus Saccharimonadales bacterium]|nr:hypothetical protein [Candidatus Saccharimonadales bacterium]
MASQYKAGSVNIGKEEINYRRKVVGYGSAAVGTALYIMLVFFNVPILLYLSMLVPVFISIHGLNEARHKFATGYAKAGKYNMSGEVGQTQDVISRDKRRLDRACAKRLINGSLRISVVVTIILTLLSRLMD